MNKERVNELLALTIRAVAAIPDGVDIWRINIYDRPTIHVNDCRPCGEATKRYRNSSEWPIELTAVVEGCEVFSLHKAKFLPAQMVLEPA